MEKKHPIAGPASRHSASSAKVSTQRAAGINLGRAANAGGGRTYLKQASINLLVLFEPKEKATHYSKCSFYIHFIICIYITWGTLGLVIIKDILKHQSLSISRGYFHIWSGIIVHVRW